MIPLVTIMIPTYNQGAYLGDAIQSALAQDYPNLEIIVADDCSTDETSAVAMKFLNDVRLKYHRNTTNLGKTNNYQRTLYNLANGDWTLNLDGDDYLTDKQYISFAMEQIGVKKDVVLFSAGVIEIPWQKYRRSRTHRLVKKQICTEGANLFLNWYQYKIPHLTSLYHRQTACQIGFYDVDIQSTDWESLLRLVLQGKVILSERIVGVWRKHITNVSQSLTYPQFIDNFAFIKRSYEHAIKKGIDKVLLGKWKQKMVHTIMKGQFNEAWHKVLNGRNRKEIKQFIINVKKEKPEFLINVFQPKNAARFFFCYTIIVLRGLLKLIKTKCIYSAHNK